VSLLLDPLFKTSDNSSLSVACSSPHYEYVCTSLDMDEELLSNAHIIKGSMLLLKIFKLKMIKIVTTVQLM
jgi:hypothetical protein